MGLLQAPDKGESFRHGFESQTGVLIPAGVSFNIMAPT
jgi:hypothetical protein